MVSYNLINQENNMNRAEYKSKRRQARILIQCLFSNNKRLDIQDKDFMQASMFCHESIRKASVLIHNSITNFDRAIYPINQHRWAVKHNTQAFNRKRSPQRLSRRVA